jgi:hypothetical protein
MKTDIAATLRRLNRKERYWVVRNALGEQPPKLSKTFCANLKRAFGGGVRSDGNLSPPAPESPNPSGFWAMTASHWASAAERLSL